MVSRYTSCALAWILCMSLHIVCTSFVNTITKSLNDPYLLRSDAPELTNQTTNNKQQTNKQTNKQQKKIETNNKCFQSAMAQHGKHNPSNNNPVWSHYVPIMIACSCIVVEVSNVLSTVKCRGNSSFLKKAFS
jgi:hypothetical protein